MRSVEWVVTIEAVGALVRGVGPWHAVGDFDEVFCGAALGATGRQTKPAGVPPDAFGRAEVCARCAELVAQAAA